MDSRTERFRHAQQTGLWEEFPAGGGIPMTTKGGKIVPAPGHVAAAKRRRAMMFGRMEIEHGINEM